MAAKSYIVTLMWAALLLIFPSCKKELDFEYHDIAPITVIEGALTAEGAEVTLTLTTPMDEPMNRTPLTDATVTITDLTEGSGYVLAPDSHGNFTDATPGIVGHEYRLSVVRQGETFTAETRMYPAVEILDMEFNWIKMPYDDVAVLQVSFTDDPESQGDCYWVRLYRNGEAYMWTEVQDFMAVDGRIDEVFMTSRKDLDQEDEATMLVDGDVITATVVRIDRRLHDYLEAIRGNSNGPAMFSGPLCLGYFTAGALTGRSITFRPADIPYFPQ